MILTKIKANQNVKVKLINTDDIKIKRRLCDLGIYSGESITVLKTSILKKVILIAVKNYCLCLKSAIAETIEVESE